MSKIHRLYLRPWACALHRGELTEPVNCKFFEIGLPRTASRSVFFAARKMGLKAVHGTGGCEQCRDNWVSKYVEGECDLRMYQCYEYSGQSAFVHWEQLSKEREESKFILTERPLDSWRKSFKRRIRTSYMWRKGSWNRLGYESMCGHLRPRFWRHNKLVDKLYRDYVGRIKEYFKGTDRLLVLNIWTMKSDELWGSLADFLGTKPPQKPSFPKRISPVRLYRFENTFRRSDGIENLA